MIWRLFGIRRTSAPVPGQTGRARRSRSRRWAQAVALSLIFTICAGLANPRLWRMRRAEFIDTGRTVLMTMQLPELLRDGDAVEAVESGFSTTLVFDYTLYEAASSKPIASGRRTVEIRRDLWQQRYVVVIRDDQDKAPVRLEFAQRDDAIQAAVGLSRIRLAESEQMRRGSADGSSISRVPS